MKRNAERKLERWADASVRKPLVLRGARQVGKTWLLKEFGRRRFENVAYFSFDREDAPHAAFANKDPRRIVEILEILAGFKFTESKTLLVLDEIQECPNALGALKYFCEDMPGLHVAAAGSLLGTLLAKPMSYPVGKVSLLDVRPMDFAEFLRATEPKTAQLLDLLRPMEPVEEVFHLRLTDAYHKYLIVGGMPECVQTWVETRDVGAVAKVQDELVAFYEGDFGKHLGATEAMRVLRVFRSIVPQLAKENEKFVYGAVRDGARGREFENAVEWAVSAGLFTRVLNVSKPEVPHAAFERANCFKLFLFDTGLVGRMARVPPAAIVSGEAYQFKGPLTENYVLQQLLGVGDAPPHYYSVKNGHEIDFLLQHGTETVPVEVKGGEAVRSPSLRGYVKNRKPRLAIRFSERNFRHDGPMCSVPLYFAPRCREVLDAALGRALWEA